MRFHLVITLILTLCISLPYVTAEGRKTGYRMKKTEKKDSGATADSLEMVPGTFMVASQCPTCNNGYKLGQIVFTGFDKNKNSSRESFFIINNTDRTLRRVTLYIDYRTPDGRQLHKRFISLTCDIPAGETRKADIDTWDTQRSFYYEKSTGSHKGGNPFTIIFDPIAYWLQF